MKPRERRFQDAPKSLDRPAGAAFLLAQLGAHCAAKFAERLRDLKLIPAHAGILRILGRTEGMTQQAMAATLRIFPSRLVAVLDELETRGLIERLANRHDRRRHALHLTDKGRSILEQIGRVARDHQRDLLAALADEEKKLLADLLQRVADEQGLARLVHPGYSRVAPSGKTSRPNRPKSRSARADQAG